jgi:uncharacterized membrane protein
MASSSPLVPVPGVARVAAHRGIDWWRSAFRWMLAPGNFGVWLGIGLLSLLLSLASGFLPLVGAIASPLVFFLLAGGLALAARKSAHGSVPAYADLFAGLGPSAGRLLIAGLLSAGAGAVVGGLMMTFALGGIFGVIAAGTAGAAGLAAPDAIAGMLAGVGLTSLLLTLVGLLLLVAISMAAWLAPALIVLRDVAPLDALMASLRAGWSNGAALTVYGLGFIALALVASIPFGLGWIVLAPLCGLSTYAAYQDIFGDG